MDVDAAKDAIMSAAIAILEINEAVGNNLPYGYYKEDKPNTKPIVSNVSSIPLLNQKINQPTNTEEPDNINPQNTNLQRIQVNQQGGRHSTKKRVPRRHKRTHRRA